MQEATSYVGELEKKWGRPDLKEHGLTRTVMDSLAYFIYTHSPEQAVITIYNEWARESHFISEDLDCVAAILEHIRKLRLVDREDLWKALIMDGLIP